MQECDTGPEYIVGILDFLGCLAVPLWKDWSLDMVAVPLDVTGKFSLRGECPHCSHDAVFSSVAANYVESRGGNKYLYVSVLRCQGCLEFILGFVQHYLGTSNYAYQSHYPISTPNDSVAEEIPDHIKPDFREAIRCLSVKAYNATGEMCRRAIEASCLDLGAPKKQVLEDMIDWLEEKRIITPGLKDVAHKVRLGGNRCAHPTSPQTDTAAIVTIGPEHAAAIVDFTKHFFQYVYVTPKQLDKYDFSKPKEIKK